VQAYVFVATTGRSGTVSLCRIFEHCVEGVVCFHEPHPVMFSDYPRRQGIDREEYFRERFFKLKRIYIKRGALGHKYYVETNHQFIKTFALAAIPYFGSKTRIIHLKRDPVSVGLSFYCLDSVPGKTPRGHYYMLDPEDQSNIIQVRELLDEHSEFGHDLYKCLWYWYEIEARVKQMKERFPSANWVTIRTEQLNDKLALQTMFQELGMPVDLDRLENMVPRSENTRVEEKKGTLDWERCDEMNRKLRTKIEESYGRNFLLDHNDTSRNGSQDKREASGHNQCFNVGV
ncbi:MAG: hypothetical protein ACE5JU_23960, partial [Candidatus Binatia bacterium]